MCDQSEPREVMRKRPPCPASSMPRGHREPILLLANLRHDVKHLSGNFSASFIVGSSFRRRVIAKPGVGVMYGIPGCRALYDGTGLVRDAASHQGDEISFRIGIGIVKLGIGSDGRSVVRI